MNQKSVHLCNVANMAYGYCKILSEMQNPVELYCNNIKHLMSQPEWDDLNLDPEQFQDENDFSKNQGNFGDYQRPAWFHSTSLLTYNHPIFVKASRILPANMIQKIKPYYIDLWKSISSAISIKSNSHWDKRFKELMKISDQYGEKWKIQKKDLHLFLNQAKWLLGQYSEDDVLFGYMYAPITMMLLGTNPSVSVEIGTLRDVASSEDTLSKLMRLAYRTSSHLLITNPDGKPFADALDLPNGYTFIPHPVDEDIYKPLEASGSEIQKLRTELGIPLHYDYYLLAPARQNWKVKGNDKYFRAFAELIRSNINALLIIPAWGQEVQRSKKFCEENNIRNILWIKPICEKRMIQYFHAVDVVLDQFELSVFGLITPKALACGKPVLTSYREEFHRWCFKDHPPLLSADSDKAIFTELKRLYENKELARQISFQSRAWVLEHYSKARVLETMEKVMKIAIDNFRRKVG